MHALHRKRVGVSRGRWGYSSTTLPRDIHLTESYPEPTVAPADGGKFISSKKRKPKKEFQVTSHDTVEDGKQCCARKAHSDLGCALCREEKREQLSAICTAFQNSFTDDMVLWINNGMMPSSDKKECLNERTSRREGGSVNRKTIHLKG